MSIKKCFTILHSSLLLIAVCVGLDEERYLRKMREVSNSVLNIICMFLVFIYIEMKHCQCLHQCNVGLGEVSGHLFINQHIRQIRFFQDEDLVTMDTNSFLTKCHNRQSSSC